MNGRTRWIPYLLCVVLAVMALWPVSVFPQLFHRTPNTPLHLMVLDHLQAFFRGEVRDMAMVVAADWPTGRPVRIIGWPFQLLAMPLVVLVGPVAALNLALLLCLILSGAAFVWMMERMELGLPARCVGGAAWVLNPLMIGFLSNGQYENHVGWAFPLVWIGLSMGGLRGGLMLGFAMVGAAFSSPYQAIPVAVVLVVALLHQRRQDPWVTLGILTLAFIACYMYFSGPQPSPGGECGPTSGAMPAVLSDLVRDLRGVPMAPQGDRWDIWTASLVRPIHWSRNLDLHDLSVTPSVGFLGFVPLFLGLLGLYRFRRASWTPPVAWAGLICGVLALGSSLSLTRFQTVAAPMPWNAAAMLPGVSEMGTTLRFLTGTVFALVVGLALVAEWASRALQQRGVGRAGTGAVILIGLLAVGADWLYGTVSPVPIKSAALGPPAGFDALPDTGAVMAVPVQAQVPPEAHLWIGVVLGHPVVGYCRTDIEAMRRQYAFVDYAQGGPLPDPSAAIAELQRLSESGVSYVAFLVPDPGRDRFEAAQRRIMHVLGPPDAAGDGVFGYRTRR